jgi:integrase
MRSKRKIKLDRLRALWRDYTAFQANQLAESTIKRDYHKVSRILEKIPSHIGTSIELRDWLLKHYAAESTRRIIQQLNACCKWAVASDRFERNPFEGVGYLFRRKVNPTTWIGFTAEERDLIVATFEQSHPFHAPWVKFLFYTGCRPEEAAALQWKHIPPNCSQIQFREAVPVDTKTRQTTKNKTARVFPCNERLSGLLRSLRPTAPNSEDLVFTGVKGGAFEYHNFQSRQWKPTVEELVEQGKVSLYLPQYNCRHTFITLALPHLTVKDIAYLVGNSPTIIYKHYASRSRVLQIPEF